MQKKSRAARLRVMTIAGTRPEVIKMAPVIWALQKARTEFTPINVLTGQHREMVAPYVQRFKLQIDHDLAIMRRGQSLDDIAQRILTRLPPVLRATKPDIVLVQGDTTSAFAAALAAFHNGIAVGHVEAGLRSHNRSNPYPEEMNRRLIGTLADLHFAPTASSSANLLREGAPKASVMVTGNTVIDTLQWMARAAPSLKGTALGKVLAGKRRVIAVTTHRRESFGLPLRNTLEALRQLVRRYEDVDIVFPVHYNPNVRSEVQRLLAGVPRVHLLEPLPYELFVQLLKRATLVLTDSGGIQEEAPGLGKPVLVLRDTTERPEGVRAGTAKLVGTDVNRIVRTASRLLDDERAYKKMAQATNPYGDGQASARILAGLRAWASKRAS